MNTRNAITKFYISISTIDWMVLVLILSFSECGISPPNHLTHIDPSVVVKSLNQAQLRTALEQTRNSNTTSLSCFTADTFDTRWVSFKPASRLRQKAQT